VHLLAAQETDLTVPVVGIIGAVSDQQSIAVIDVVVDDEEQHLAFIVELDVLGVLRQLPLILKGIIEVRVEGGREIGNRDRIQDILWERDLLVADGPERVLGVGANGGLDQGNGKEAIPCPIAGRALRLEHGSSGCFARQQRRLQISLHLLRISNALAARSLRSCCVPRMASATEGGDRSSRSTVDRGHQPCMEFEPSELLCPLQNTEDLLYSPSAKRCAWPLPLDKS
jgi:hypothetical protein